MVGHSPQFLASEEKVTPVRRKCSQVPRSTAATCPDLATTTTTTKTSGDHTYIYFPAVLLALLNLIREGSPGNTQADDCCFVLGQTDKPVNHPQR